MRLGKPSPAGRPVGQRSRLLQGSPNDRVDSVPQTWTIPSIDARKACMVLPSGAVLTSAEEDLVVKMG